LFVSGILNIFLTKNGKTLKDPVHKVWIHFFEFKFILALFLTPAVYPFTTILVEEGETQISENMKNKIQFYIVCFMFLYSPLIKYYREEICLNFEVDIIMEKVKELQNRYEASSLSKDKPLPTDDSDIKRTLPTEPAPKSRHQRNEHQRAGQTGGTTESEDIQNQLRDLQRKEAALQAKLQQAYSHAPQRGSDSPTILSEDEMEGELIGSDEDSDDIPDLEPPSDFIKMQNQKAEAALKSKMMRK